MKFRMSVLVLSPNTQPYQVFGVDEVFSYKQPTHRFQAISVELYNFHRVFRWS